MTRQVKRYAIISDNWDYVESPTGGFIDHDDYAALEAECDSLWSTYVALVDKLGIDTEKAKTADGKPSDVIVSYVDALRAENERLRKAADGLVAKIEAAKYRLASSRTWAGMGWGLPHLDPRRQQEVLVLLTDAYAMLTGDMIKEGV